MNIKKIFGKLEKQKLKIILFILVFASGLSSSTNQYDNRESINSITPLGSHQFLPELIGTYDNNSLFIRDVFTDGDLAYLCVDGYGLIILNISDPSNPVNIGEYYCGSRILHISVTENIVILSRDNEGLKIINVSVPENPIEITDFSDGKSVFKSYVVGNVLYFCDSDGLKIANISDPASPQKIGEYTADGAFTNVMVSGNYAYVSQSSTGLYIINISDLSNPIRIGHFYDGGNTCNLFYLNNHVYLSDSDDGLEVISVTSRSYPVERSQFSSVGFCTCLYIYDYIAYVGFLNGNLTIVDISSPTNPKQVGLIDEHFFTNIFVTEEFVFVCRGDCGLDIYQKGHDEDDDGLTDKDEEELYNTLPNNPDSDDDGLNDFEEVITYQTNPNDRDTDDDNYGDAEEIQEGTDPNDNESYPGSNLNSVPGYSIWILGISITLVVFILVKRLFPSDTKKSIY